MLFVKIHVCLDFHFKNDKCTQVTTFLFSWSIYIYCYTGKDKLPNILVLSVEGIENIDNGFNISPTLTKLSNQGIRFTDDSFILKQEAAGSSMPSRRGSFLSGNKHPFSQDEEVIPLSDALPWKLQSLGYRTIGIGKWHLNYDEHVLNIPTSHGFQVPRSHPFSQPPCSQLPRPVFPFLALSYP